MKFAKFAVLGAVLAASAPFASATPITGQLSLIGPNSYTATNITFGVGNSMIAGAITGTSFTPFFTDGQIVTMTNFAIDGSFVPTTVFSVTENSVTLTYFLQTLTTTFSNAGISGGFPGDLTLIGTGFFTETGFSDTAATFNLTSQVGQNAGTGVTFSETSFAPAPTVPEPSSIALLGSGLVGAALFMRRKLMA